MMNQKLTKRQNAAPPTTRGGSDQEGKILPREDGGGSRRADVAHKDLRLQEKIAGTHPRPDKSSTTELFPVK